MSCNAATSGCNRTGASATRPSADAVAPPRRVVGVAYSGGRDSTALLHATAATAAVLGTEVVALHVHHGLSAEADRWLAHGEATCSAWVARGLSVRFVSHRLIERPAPGESVEAWARKARYRALREMAIAAGTDLVLLGHHRRDQAETFVLQALRGGGPPALAAMPRQVERDGVTWARPWLDEPREAIEAYVRRHGLAFVDDDSNVDDRFARNRLRARVWPALAAAFTGAEASLADAARRAGNAAAALGELAAIDLAHVTRDGAIDIAAWRSLSPARRDNVLRAWIRLQGRGRAPASLVERLAGELNERGSRRWSIAGGELRSYRGALRFEAEAGATVDAASAAIDLGHPGRQACPGWRGCFVVERVGSGGIAVELARRLQVRARRPTDRFQSGPGRPPRSLKLQFQSAAVPAWQRDGPVLDAGGAPVFVAGLGVDARWLAPDGVEQVRLRWERC